MKKFLAVFDGYKMSESTMKYGIELAKSTGAHLVGVFLDESIYYGYNLSKVIATHKNYEKELKELDRDDAQKRARAILEFQTACEKTGIRFSIHKDEIISIQELKNESMFTDLIIMNEHETFNKSKEVPPTRFVKDLLGSAQCPVLLVPSIYKPVEKIILLYDGAPAALHAIKMFSYVLGNPHNLPVKAFTVKEIKASEFFVPENKLMREFVKQHFPKATFAVSRGNPEQEIKDYLGRLPKEQIVVMGAYQRSEISRWFKVSMADILMKELDMPLFIAHNK